MESYETAETRRKLHTHTHTHTHTGSLLLSLKQIGTICFAFLFSIFSTNLFATDPNIPAGATSASCDNSTLNTYSGTSNLQANWEANKINLVWYSDDAQITNVQSAATSCNYDGSLSVPSNPPTKTGYTFNGWKVRGLPDGYTRLQYIQSSGTQYIDTGVKGNQNTKVEIKYSFYQTSSTTGSGRIFGSRGNGSTNSANAFVIGTNSGIVSLSTTLFMQYGSNSAASTTEKIVLNKWFSIVHSRTTHNVNGVDYGVEYSSTTFTTPFNLKLFGFDNYGTTLTGVGRMAYAKIWNGDTLIRDFIPAKNSSNVVGMYDTVSKTFFTNAGSGTFTAGPVVQ